MLNHFNLARVTFHIGSSVDFWQLQSTFIFVTVGAVMIEWSNGFCIGW
jgi:hypothetical protein